MKADEQMRYPITCAPVFDMVMRDADLCRRFIERVLGVEIGHIEYHAVEHALEPALDARGVRLDAFLKGTGAVYNIEMQASAEDALGKRMRYHQAAIDTSLLGKGALYDELPESYVIFLCAFDPYGRNIPAYTWERICKEDAQVDAACGSHWLVLNASAWALAPDEGLRKLLEYIATGNSHDALTADLDAMVDDINADPERRAHMNGFMTLEHSAAVRARCAHKRGLAEGIEQGAQEAQARYGALVDRLLDDNRLDDLKQSATDPQLLEALYGEYGL